MVLHEDSDMSGQIPAVLYGPKTEVCSAFCEQKRSRHCFLRKGRIGQVVLNLVILNNERRNIHQACNDKGASTPPGFPKFSYISTSMKLQNGSKDHS